MGINVKFLVRTKNPLTVRQFDHLSEKFEHRLECFEGYWDKLQRDRELENVFEVRNAQRYYSEGYQRGNPLPWITMAEFFEHELPGCEVFYMSGDFYCEVEDEVRFSQPWPKEEREELKRLYFSKGRSELEEGLARSTMDM